MPRRSAPKSVAPSKPRTKRIPVDVPVGTEVLLEAAQVAAALSISPATFWRMVSAGDYPQADARLGPQMPRWSQALHNAWVRRKAAGQAED